MHLLMHAYIFIGFDIHRIFQEMGLALSHCDEVIAASCAANANIPRTDAQFTTPLAPCCNYIASDTERRDIIIGLMTPGQPRQANGHDKRAISR